MDRFFNKFTQSFLKIFLIAACLLPVSCRNGLTEFADTESDEARLFEAVRALNNQNYTDAITFLDKASASFKERRDVKMIMASAYAGRCGLNFLNLVNTIGDSISSQNLLNILMSAFQSASASHVDDCESAETLMLSISSSAGGRTLDENLFLAFIGFAKIGAILGVYADTDNNGTVDPTFDSCDVGQLPEADARQIASGLTIALASLQASGSSIAGDGLDDMTSVCSDLEALGAAFNFCAITDPDDFTNDHMKAITGMIKTEDYIGLGTCADTLQNCVCLLYP